MPDIEVLAPVGNRAMLNAALAAGADAVYLGGKTGNARAFAGNFDPQALRQAVTDCHLAGTRVYLTLNTLVKNHEMEEILSFANEAVAQDIDAVILQDLGLARALRERYPDLALHASTQMNIHSLAGVRQMQALGFERIIAGRETTLEELARMRDHSDMEVELFVHGSLCVSVSGQCLFSGLVGGRSGNRGRCAQPCRKTYRGVTGKPDTLLSLRDLNTLAHMDTWRKLRIRSLKIEGRMKKPEYVFAVTKMVKAALAGEDFSTDLLDVSSRSFTKGFTLGDFGRTVSQTEDTDRGSVVGTVVKQGRERAVRLTRDSSKNDTLKILTERDKELTITTTEDASAGSLLPLPGMQDAKADSAVRRVYSGRIEQELQDALLDAQTRPVSLSWIGTEGKPAQVTAASGGHAVSVESGMVVQPAKQRPVSAEDITKRLGKTGETIFSIADISVDWDADLFLPLGEVNRMRREALELLTERLAQKYDRTERIESPLRAFSGAARPVLHLEIDDNTIPDAFSTESVARIYTSDLRNVANYRKQWNCEVYGILPEPSDRQAEEFAERYGKLFDGFLVKDPAGASIAHECGLPVQFDTSTHCMNDRAVDLLLNSFPGSGISASVELSGEEMEQASFCREAEVLAFGPVVAMKLRHCPFSVEKGCTHNRDCAACAFSQHMLTDEQGEKYFVERKNGVSLLYFHRVLDRIEPLAQSRLRPKAYRLVLRRDEVNGELVRYAAERLLHRTKMQKPAFGRYWHTQGTTDGRWKLGVE